MNPILGKKVIDLITGFAGVATGYVEYISGCNQVLVIPPVDNDGKRRDGEWFDVQRLKISDEAPIILNNESTPGCDAPAPQR